MSENKKLNTLIKKAKNAEQDLADYRQKYRANSWKHLINEYRPLRVDKNGKIVLTRKYPNSKTNKELTIARHTLKGFQDFQKHYVVFDKNDPDFVSCIMSGYVEYQQKKRERKAKYEARAKQNQQNSTN